MGADYNAVKDIPGYKIIMKAILKSQIQHLVDQLSVEAEEETVMLTASMTDGMLCHLGSNSGKIFLDNHEDFKSMFLNFCLKEKHEKRQQEKQIPSNNETSRNRSTPGPIRSSKQVPGQTKQISTPPQSSTPRGRSVRMQPYPVSKPTKTPTATSQKVNHTSTTPQRQNETATTSQTSNPEVATIKKEPLDPEVVTLPDTIEGYQILRTEADPAEGEQDQSNTGDKETDENKQNGQTGLSDTAANASANVTLSNAAISGANANAKAGVSDIDKQGVKPESLAEAELDTTDADMDVSVNIEDSLDMSELEQPGPSGLASGDVSSLEQSDQLTATNGSKLDESHHKMDPLCTTKTKIVERDVKPEINRVTAKTASDQKEDSSSNNKPVKDRYLNSKLPEEELGIPVSRYKRVFECINNKHTNESETRISGCNIGIKNSRKTTLDQKDESSSNNNLGKDMLEIPVSRYKRVFECLNDSRTNERETRIASGNIGTKNSGKTTSDQKDGSSSNNEPVEDMAGILESRYKRVLECFDDSHTHESKTKIWDSNIEIDNTEGKPKPSTDQENWFEDIGPTSDDRWYVSGDFLYLSGFPKIEPADDDHDGDTDYTPGEGRKRRSKRRMMSSGNNSSEDTDTDNSGTPVNKPQTNLPVIQRPTTRRQTAIKKSGLSHSLNKSNQHLIKVEPNENNDEVESVSQDLPNSPNTGDQQLVKVEPNKNDDDLKSVSQDLPHPPNDSTNQQLVKVKPRGNSDAVRSVSQDLNKELSDENKAIVRVLLAANNTSLPHSPSNEQLQGNEQNTNTDGVRNVCDNNTVEDSAGQESAGHKSELPENSIVRDINVPAIFIRKVIRLVEEEKGKKTYRLQDMRHACIFCKELVVNIQVHYINKHSDERMVTEIRSLKLDKNKDKQSLADVKLGILRSAGDHIHNLSTIEKKEGELLVYKRPASESFDHREYGPCPLCKDWMLKTLVKSHQTSCPALYYTADLKKHSASDETGELDNKPFQFNYIITEPANDDGPSSSDFPVLQGNKSFDSSTYGDLNKFWMQTEDQATIKQMRWATKLLQDSASDETGELDNKPFQFNYIITEPANDDGPSSSDFPVLQGNKSFDSSTYGDLNKFWMQTEDQATIKQMRWATKLLQDWMTEEGYGSVIFEDLPSFEMDRLLQQFYTAARTKDGKEYSRSTLIGLRSALNRYLTNPPFSRDINILKDREFRESNQVMSDLFKRLKRDGKDPSHKEPICDEDLQKLYNSRVFSLTSPKTLQNKVMFDVISHFGKIKQDGLRTLLKSSFICKLDDKGKKYVTLMVDESDERLYNLNRMYENDGVFCPIKSYELYVSKLNPASDLFFQSPLYSFSDDDPVWFSTRGVGINTFSTFMSRMSEKASLSRKYTNQCICARTVYKITKQPCVQLNFT